MANSIKKFHFFGNLPFKGNIFLKIKPVLLGSACFFWAGGGVKLVSHPIREKYHSNVLGSNRGVDIYNFCMCLSSLLR